MSSPTDGDIEAIARQFAPALLAHLADPTTFERACYGALHHVMPQIRTLVLREALDECRAAVCDGETAEGVRDRLGALYLGAGSS